MAIATGSRVHLPRTARGPAAVLGRRLAAAVALVAWVALVAYLGRSGYEDADGGEVTLLDAFYYATVSITTTGYGDVTPVTDGARLATTLLVTPARILFLIILIGTTVEVLAEASRTAYRTQLWRRRLRDHTIVCGFGTKGRSAVTTLRARGVPGERIVVVDPDPAAVEAATRAGLAAVQGSSTRTDTLEEAGIRAAAGVVVAPDTDEAAVLTTLTARELNPGATIVAAVREEENRHLMHQSGADSAVVTSGAAGRLLGLATDSPNLVEVVEDLITVGTGVDIVERPVPERYVGGPVGAVHLDAPVLAVVRGDRTLRFDDPEAQTLRAGDRLVCLCSNRDGERAA
jgi:voltage-gated potassium channel